MLTNRDAHSRLRWLCVVTLAVVLAQAGPAAFAKPLGEATVTQTNNDVRYQPASASERPAKSRDVVHGADVLRTGLKSQAELEFADRTITRLGSNSLFTFDPEKRNFELKSGVMLFDMPKNAGGGRIVTPGVTAAIEGTAGIVSHRKLAQIICLVGIIRILDNNGNLLMILNAGQMFLQGNKQPLLVNLRRLAGGTLLRGGLPNNQQDFDQVAARQQAQLKSGELTEQSLAMDAEGGQVAPGAPSMIPPALELIRRGAEQPGRRSGSIEGPPGFQTGS